MSDISEGPHPVDPPRDAEYLADMLGQLRRIAQDSKYKTLAYLIDMARLEASSLCEPCRDVNRRG